VVHNDKIFIINDLNPQVYDPRENTWAKWPRPVKSVGEWPCLISWTDIILVFGGDKNKKGLQSFNSTANVWSVLNAELLPFELDPAACILLPTNQVLVISFRNAALYNIQSNSWERLKDLKSTRYGSTFVNLNGRIFMYGGLDDVTEEYLYNSKKWKQVKADPIGTHMFSSALALPAEEFGDLIDGCEGVI